MDEILENLHKLSPEKRKLLELMLKEQGVDLSKRILPQSRESNRFPLSFAQQRMWFLDRLEPGNPMYNNPAAVTIRGEVNVEALRKALTAMGERHEVLRTVFEDEGGTPVQVIQEKSNLQLRELDFASLSEQEREEALQRESIREAQAPFNLRTGPLLRATLILMAPNEYIFLLTMHHIISDAWTLGVFINELAQLYEGFAGGTPVELPPLPIQYADYAFWQRDYLQGDVLKEQLDYWRQALDGADKALNLPIDHNRPKMQSFNGDVEYFKIDKDVAGALEAFSKKQDVTLFMTVLAAIHLLLHRYTGQDDITVGTPIANRNRSEVEFLLGVFVNTLVMRANLADNPGFCELLARVKDNALGAYAHQDIPFETLVEELDPQRDMSRSPFFQVMLVMQNAPALRFEMQNATIIPRPLHTPTAKYDLTIVLEPVDDGLDGQIVYNTDLFEKSTILRLLDHLKALFKLIPDHANRKMSEFPLLGDDEQKTLIDEMTNELPDNVEQDAVHALFAGRAARDSFIKCGEEQLFLPELDQRADRLAALLLSNGVAPGDIVGLYLPRSVDLIAGMLGVLKAGGIILPLDLDYPKERIAYMLQDSGARYVLTKDEISANLNDTGVNKINVDAAAETPDKERPEFPVSKPQDGAYIIYTSGSTGKPKGVLVSHGAFSSHCQAMVQVYELTQKDKVLQFASTNFDAALEQIFPTLLAGASLIMRDSQVWTPQELAKAIEKEKLTVVNLPTAYWNQFIQHMSRDESSADSSIRLLIVGGDAMRTDSLDHWQSSPLKSARLLNAYGPTEATITASLFEIDPKINLKPGVIPIGRPTPGRIFYILDKHGNLVPQGVAGELCIGGDLLASGYLGRKELTAEKFVADPFSQNKGQMYRTGDLVRMNHAGQLEFLGRVDDQVKIRGYRIELGEIETALKKHEAIIDAVVAAIDDEHNMKRLVAYVVTDGSALDVKTMRTFLGKSLPDYMIPAAFVPLADLPMTPSGKVDRKALPVPQNIRPVVQTEFVAPRTQTEKRLAEIMAGVLKVDKVGIYDNFFELGGHSMLGTQIIAQVQDEFDVELPLRALFENPTVEGMARAIAETLAENQDESDLEAILDELDGMSDEEIKKLLEDD